MERRRVLTTDESHRMRSRRGETSVIRLAALLLALAASPAWAASVQVPSDEEVPSDERIAQAVEEEIAYDPTLPHHRIDVSISDGIVRLRGRVNHVLARDRCVRIVETVRGVRSIVNEIDVVPRNDWSDEDIAVGVHNALLVDKATERHQLSTEVANGEVTLSGTVDSYQEKRLAENVVKGVEGVRTVHNQIVVEYEPERPDSEIQADVESAMEWDVLLEDALIVVDVRDAVVRLVGSVGSLAEKSRATARAWVAGVDDVDNSRLEVRPWAGDEDQRSAGVVYKADEDVRRAVEDALSYDPRVNPDDVTASVVRGAVTLRGTVDSLKARRAAGQDARNTVGVRRVVNQLAVRANERTDAEIRSEMETAFFRDPVVEESEVTVEIDDGLVTLTGEVGTYFEKAQAEDIASTVGGVHGVKNRIAVDPGERPEVYSPYIDEHYLLAYDWYGTHDRRFTFKSDAEIQANVEERLWWSPFVDADEVNVSVEDGVATLTGTVDTWAERDAATEKAFEGGAVIVDNDLVIRGARQEPSS